MRSPRAISFCRRWCIRAGASQILLSNLALVVEKFFLQEAEVHFGLGHYLVSHVREWEAVPRSGYKQKEAWTSRISSSPRSFFLKSRHSLFTSGRVRHRK